MTPALRRRPRRRLGGAVAAAGLAVVLGIGVYVPATLTADLDDIRPTAVEWTAPAPAVAPLGFPSYGASAIGAVGWTADGVDDGPVLASSGATSPLPIASISKVVTALVVLEARPLTDGDAGPMITLGAADAALYDAYLRIDGKVVPSPAGLALTEREMLEVTLVSSANNYADSLATWAFGSREGYLAAASDWLARHGFSGTTIVEPTGMSPSNTSTTTDLVGLGMLALADPVVSEIVSTPSVTIAALGTLKNSNSLLGLDGIDGIKTGTLDEAGACLLFSAELPVGGEDITVVGVVLGGADHDSLDIAIRALLADVRAGFREVLLTVEGEPFGTYETGWDASARAVAAEDASVVVWSDTPVTAEVTVDPVDDAAFDDARVDAGTVVFRAGERVVEVPLVLDAPIRSPDGWWRITHPAEIFNG